MISLLFVAVNSALLGHALFLQLQAVFGWHYIYYYCYYKCLNIINIIIEEKLLSNYNK